MPKVLIEFVVDLMKSWLRRKGMGTFDVLAQHPSMGMHTDVLFFQSAKYDTDGSLLRQKQVLRCIYSHPRRPFGHALPGCPLCGLSTLKLFSFNPTWMVLRCNRCSTRFAYERPKGCCWMVRWSKDKDLPNNEAWLVEEYKAPTREALPDESFFPPGPPPRHLTIGESVANLPLRSPTPFA
jgi:hypothetical protein